MFVHTGKTVEGDEFTAVEVIPMNEIQQHGQAKYNKDVRYQWYSFTSQYTALCFSYASHKSLPNLNVLVARISQKHLDSFH